METGTNAPLRDRAQWISGRARRWSMLSIWLASTLTFATCAAPVAAHDIPAEVTIQAWLKPEGSRLFLLVRAPLQALRDIDYPRQGDQGLLDISRSDAALREAATVWLARDITVYEGDAPLGEPQVTAVRASLPADGAFHSYESARAQLDGPPLPNDTPFVWEQGVLDARFEYPIVSDRARFAVDARWGRLGLRTTTAMRLLTPDGPERAFELAGDEGLVRLDPRWHQAAARFVRLGFFHILDGTDHLLFLLCLVIPFRRMRPLLGIVTAFTVAHSVTLLASAFDFAPTALWFPPLVEMLIAASIVYTALENVLSVTPTRRWILAFGFGLVHGFGFSFALRQTLQFAGAHLLLSLVSFNAGIELGQIAALALVVPLLRLLFRAVPERPGSIMLSAIVAHTGWHWMVDRAGAVRQYTFAWPALSTALWLDLVRWGILAVAVAAAAWVVSAIVVHLWRPGARGDTLDTTPVADAPGSVSANLHTGRKS